MWSVHVFWCVCVCVCPWMHTHSYELLPMIIVMQHLLHTSPGVLCRAKQLFRAVETVCATAPVWFPSEMQTKHEARKDFKSEEGGRTLMRHLSPGSLHPHTPKCAAECLSEVLQLCGMLAKQHTCAPARRERVIGLSALCVVPVEVSPLAASCTMLSR